MVGGGWVGGPGGDLLSRALRHSTMGAGVFHGRVRDGIGCRHPAKATRSSNPPPRGGGVGQVLVEGCVCGIRAYTVSGGNRGAVALVMPALAGGHTGVDDCCA